MRSVSSSARADFVVEALAQLVRLRREMGRLALRDENYESNRRALQEAIRELRKLTGNRAQ